MFCSWSDLIVLLFQRLKIILNRLSKISQKSTIVEQTSCLCKQYVKILKLNNSKFIVFVSSKMIVVGSGKITTPEEVEMMKFYLARVFCHLPVTKKITKEIYHFVSHSHCSRVFTTIFKVQITPFEYFFLFQTNNYYFRNSILFLFKDNISLFLPHHSLIYSLILLQSIRIVSATAQ